MKVRKKYATDEKAISEGVWVDFGDGARCRIARFNNPRHAAYIDELRKPYRAILRTGGAIPEEKATEITIKSIARCVLTDWAGFEEDDGSAMPYSEASAVELLTELPDFRNRIVQIATQQENYRVETLELAAKNSEAGSTGRSGSEKRRAN